jgi:peptide deformylase
MAILDILIWPDPQLLEISEPIAHIDDALKQLAEDMLETMYDADGVGLAAPQVGIQKRMVIIDIHAGADERPSGEPPLTLINPEFIEKEGELTWEEGCLSVPGELGEVTRAAKVKMKYTDLEGQEHVIEAEGLKAVALQHECDHLDGKLFVDYLSRLKRNVIRRRMNKLRAEQGA